MTAYGIKTGNLSDDFKLFHLKDKNNIKFDYHYHDFNKLIIFISGNVVYNIEGKAYELQPWDILLVPSGQVHKPLIEPITDYERIVLWINNSFLEQHSSQNEKLLNCFFIAKNDMMHVIRPHLTSLDSLKRTLSLLEKEIKGSDFAGAIMANSLFVQLIISINRLYIKDDEQVKKIEVQYDESILKMVQYINSNIEKDLSIDFLSSKFFINKYYLMHKFKASTGYTIHNYINNKRLIKATELIKSGICMSEVAQLCGFNDYSSFVRAFKKHFEMSPKKYLKQINSLYKQIVIEG